MEDSANARRFAAIASCRQRRILPQKVVGNPVRNGWFLVTLELTRSLGSRLTPPPKTCLSQCHSCLTPFEGLTKQSNKLSRPLTTG